MSLPCPREGKVTKQHLLKVNFKYLSRFFVDFLLLLKSKFATVTVLLLEQNKLVCFTPLIIAYHEYSISY